MDKVSTAEFPQKRKGEGAAEGLYHSAHRDVAKSISIICGVVYDRSKDMVRRGSKKD